MGCLLGAVLAAGCRTPFKSFPDLTYAGPSDPMATGSLARFGVVYADSNSTCAQLCERVHIDIKELLSSESSNPDVLEIVGTEGTFALVRARKEGTSTLTLRALDTNDMPVSQRIKVGVLDPDRLDLAPSCTARGQSGLLPVSMEHVFDFRAFKGDRMLYASGIDLVEDPGALISKGPFPNGATSIERPMPA